MRKGTQNTELGTQNSKAFVSKAIFVVSCLLIPAFTASGSPFAGGTGGPNDPYRIATAEQLCSIGSDPNLLNKHFILVADIDLDPNIPGNKVFNRAVIAPDLDNFNNGFQGTAFTGRFDGQGYVIRGLAIFGTNFLGLFGYISNDGAVLNLGLENVYIKGTYWAFGGLVGSNNGTVSNCYSTGTVTVSSTSYVDAIGGLVGMNRGMVSNCYSTASVNGNSSRVGGLVGSNSGTISNGFSSGSVGGNHDIGGLVGMNSGTVLNSFNSGSVSGNRHIGGLVGFQIEGSVSKSYSTGSIRGGVCVGGLVGYNFSRVFNCYSTGSVTGSWVGGLVGYNDRNQGKRKVDKR